MEPTPKKDLAPEPLDGVDTMAVADSVNDEARRIVFEAWQGVATVGTDYGATYDAPDGVRALRGAAVLDALWIALGDPDPKVLEQLERAVNGAMRAQYDGWQPAASTLSEAALRFAPQLRALREEEKTRREIADPLALAFEKFVRTPMLKGDHAMIVRAILRAMPLNHGNAIDAEGSFADERFGASGETDVGTMRAAMVAIGVRQRRRRTRCAAWTSPPTRRETSDALRNPPNLSS